MRACVRACGERDGRLLYIFLTARVALVQITLYNEADEESDWMTRPKEMKDGKKKNKNKKKKKGRSRSRDEKKRPEQKLRRPKEKAVRPTEKRESSKEKRQSSTAEKRQLSKERQPSKGRQSKGRQLATELSLIHI